ncbi:MAG: hypothetical protein ACLR6O_02790 [Eubacterium sp.]
MTSKMKEAADNGKLDEFVNKNLSEKATKQLKDVLSNKEAMKNCSIHRRQRSL